MVGLKSEMIIPVKKNCPTVRLRSGFSDRNGLIVQNVILQIKDFDNRTRIAMLNQIKFVLQFIDDCDRKQETFKMRALISDIISNVYVQELAYNVYNYDVDWFIKSYIKPTILEDDFCFVLDLLEYFYNRVGLLFPDDAELINKTFNDLLQSEYVGYRLIDNKIVSITNENEIKEITDALKIKHNDCKSHLDKALSLFSNRENPDFENSIKESISAVESVCKIITNTKKGSLDDAIKKLKDKGIVIQPAMETAFIKLFAYTSDANGIRHANGVGEGKATFEDAKFMLVTCSAFVNYLNDLYAD